MKILGLKWVATTVAAGIACSVVFAETGKDAGAKETLTVVSPNADGSVKILTEESKAAEPAKADKGAKEATTDTSPRKARIVAVPAVYAQELRSRN